MDFSKYRSRAFPKFVKRSVAPKYLERALCRNAKGKAKTMMAPPEVAQAGSQEASLPLLQEPCRESLVLVSGAHAEALLVRAPASPPTASPVLRTQERARASTPTAALLQLSGTDSHSLPWSLGLWAEHNQNLFLLHECSFWVWPPLPRMEEAQGEEGSSRSLVPHLLPGGGRVLPTPWRGEGAGEQVNEWETCP